MPIAFLCTVCRQTLFAVVKQMALLCLHTAYYGCEESHVSGPCLWFYPLCVDYVVDVALSDPQEDDW